MTSSVQAAPRRHRFPIFLGLLIAFLALSAWCGRPQDMAGLSSGEVKYAVRVLSEAPSHGFAPGAFAEDRLAKLIASDTAADQREAQAQLMASLAAYARAQHGRSIPAKAWPSNWGLKPPPYDAEAELRRAIAAGELRAWLDGLAPRSQTYEALRAAYKAQLDLVAAGGWPKVPPGPELGPGAKGPRVAALRRRLSFEDPALAETAPDAPYDPRLAAAVSAFQAAHGFDPTGRVGPQTLKELNVPAAGRAAQIRASLERLRWLPRTAEPTRIEVNIAAAVLDYFKDGRRVMHMRAASGKVGDETPMLASSIERIVLNPPWNVPKSIAAEELYPKAAADPGYFARERFVEKADGEGSRLVQLPGPESALGLVKFEFDNPYAVYLHDTPSRQTFSKPRRAVSHGCVRLERALDLAGLLLADEAAWTPERIGEVLASGETTFVDLSRPVPVRLVYLTAFPEDGRVVFRPDVYGWDARLLRLLDDPRRRPTPARP